MHPYYYNVTIAGLDQASHGPVLCVYIGVNKVLVVDDELELVEIIAMALENDGVTVFTATDGLEALTIALEERPKLVLADIMMPHMDGVELCRRLREHPSTRETVVLLMSAGRRIDLGECGAVDLVRKPFILQDLLATVHRHLDTA